MPPFFDMCRTPNGTFNSDEERLKYTREKLQHYTNFNDYIFTMITSFGGISGGKIMHYAPYLADAVTAFEELKKISNMPSTTSFERAQCEEAARFHHIARHQNDQALTRYSPGRVINLCINQLSEQRKQATFVLKGEPYNALSTAFDTIQLDDGKLYEAVCDYLIKKWKREQATQKLKDLRRAGLERTLLQTGHHLRSQKGGATTAEKQQLAHIRDLRNQARSLPNAHQYSAPLKKLSVQFSLGLI